MHELVAEHVIARLDGAGKRQDDASFVGLGDSPGALAQLALDGVGLTEVRPAGVEDERLAGLNWWLSSCDSRVYHRSAIRDAIWAACSSSG